MKEKITLKFRFERFLNNIRKKNEIEVQIPKNFMNCGISINNNFIADTNDSQNWDTLSFPLPKPKYKWNIYSQGFKLHSNKKIVVLTDNK